MASSIYLTCLCVTVMGSSVLLRCHSVAVGSLANSLGFDLMIIVSELGA